MTIFDQLAAPFSQVHWRAQNMRSDGTSALALAYIDARDVMARLDEAVGPQNWQDRYAETPKGRLICTLSVRIDGEWIAKSDGAGDTDVEGDKGAISDSLKRAAVKWGIGRYLYDLGDTWAECEPMKKSDGTLFLNAKNKPQFKKWTPRGLADLQRALGAVAAVAPPVSRPNMLSGDDRDIITGLAQAAGITLLRICKEYDVADLTEIPASKANEIKDRLTVHIDTNASKKVAA